MTERVRTTNGIEGALAVPPGSGQAPGLVVVHEWWGLNDDVRAVAGRFAAEGFLALAVDLYHGAVTRDPGEAMALMQKLDTGLAMKDVEAAVHTLAAHPRSSGKVGITGFCMGGAMAFAAAQAVPGLACAVPFYGIPVAAYWDPAKVRVPIQAHFAGRDEWAKPSRAADFQKGVLAAGGRMELHVYDADHAFMRARDPKVHDPASAAAAWSRTLAFLRAELG